MEVIPITAGAQCNVCGSTNLFQRRRQIICGSCQSDTRTRLMWLFLRDKGLLCPGSRVLHFAPERCLAGRLRAALGEGYEPVDAQPANFPDVPGIRSFDLVTEAAELPSGGYDLIIHSHVMEHIRCNVTAVLFHLHRALTESGCQLLSVPIARNACYAEDLSPLSPEEATRRYGQDDHVRRFGALDIATTLGMIFRLPRQYDLLDEFDEETLDRCCIHPAVRQGWSPSTVLALKKRDLLLTS